MPNNKLEEAMELFQKARLMDKRKCVLDIIKLIDDKKAYEFVEPKSLGNNMTEFGYYNYNEKLFDLTKIIESDYDYQQNFKLVKDKNIDEFTMKDIETYITWIFRSERFVLGNIAELIDNGILKKILNRYLEIYKGETIMKKLPSEEDIKQIVNKILSLRKNKRFTIGDFLKKFDLTEDEKNSYAKQIYEGILGYVDFISGGNYTYDTLPCEKNERRPEKAVLRKTMLDNDGKEYETEEELDTTNIPDDMDSLKNALNKSKLKAIVDKYNIDYTKNLVSNEDLIKFEKIIDCKFGKQLKEYLLHYGYMGYKSIEFYGINSKQLEKSDMITQSLYLHEYFPKTKGLIAFENQDGHNFAMVDSEDAMHYYNNLTDEIFDTNTQLFDFILNQFKYVSQENLNKLKLLEKIEIKYNIPGMTVTLHNVLTNQEKTYQDARLLSLEEILNANEDLQVDFVSYGLIPVFDVYDNDFICYQTKDGNWCKFNIVDEIRFQKDSRLEDLLK